MEVPTVPRRKGRSSKEEIQNPRPRNGNTYAVGAYLEALRKSAGLTREPLVRQIINEMAGNITMSLSTLTQIEAGANKSVSAATIDAIRKAVHGDPYDISDLWKVPIPDDNDETGIKSSRLEGEARAVARLQKLAGGSPIQVIAENSSGEIAKMLNRLASDKQLLQTASELADDPEARAIVEAVLRARRGKS